MWEQHITPTSTLFSSQPKDKYADGEETNANSAFCVYFATDKDYCFIKHIR